MLTLQKLESFLWQTAEKGYGRKIVDAVDRVTPDDWNLVVVMDWSGGFWEKMLEENPRIVVL